MKQIFPAGLSLFARSEKHPFVVFYVKEGERDVESLGCYVGSVEVHVKA